MPAPTPKDSVIVTQVGVELAKIGTGPTEWLTNPPDATEGSPGDRLPDVPHQLYFAATEAPLEDAPVNVTEHPRRLVVSIYIIAKKTTAGWAEVRKLKADVLRALYAAEDAFEAICLQWAPGPFLIHNELQPAGFLAGVLDVTFDYNSEHATP